MPLFCGVVRQFAPLISYLQNKYHPVNQQPLFNWADIRFEVFRNLILAEGDIPSTMLEAMILFFVLVRGNNFGFDEGRWKIEFNEFSNYRLNVWWKSDRIIFVFRPVPL